MAWQCGLCPNNCNIPEGGRGICGVRECVNGNLELPYYGFISAVSSDPIEKKPLYHFFPGIQIFSVGFYGCSLACPFCQNFNISKVFSAGGPSLSPEVIVEKAISSGASAVAYTYSEPIVHFEWVTETAKLASEAGLKNVLVTNGYINEAYSEELIADIDAVNIDLKSFRDDFYREELHGKLEPVLAFIKKSAENIHTEVTTLVIPGKNDSAEEIKSAASFLADIDKNIPYHLSAYYPSYKYVIEPTEPDKLVRLSSIASEYLNFVFTGNISGGINDSLCPECGNKLITRNGYYVQNTGINSGKCSSCNIDVNTYGIII